MALTTQAEVEKYLQIDVAAEPSPVVDFAIESAQAVIERWCDRLFEDTTYTDEAHDGGHQLVFARQWPVTAITGITEDGVAVPSNEYVWYSDGRIYRTYADDSETFNRWASGRQNVLVSYQAGYATVPYDLRLIATAIAARIFKQGAEWANGVEPGVTKESIGDYRATYVAAREVAPEEVMLPIERKLLGSYVRRI